MGIFDSIKDALTGHDSHDPKDETPTTADVPFDPTLDDPSLAPDASAEPTDQAATDPTSTTDQQPADATVGEPEPETASLQEETVQEETVQAEFVPTEPAPAEPAPEAAAPAPEPETYTVVEGDNLTWIGERFGVSVDQLVEANGIENPDLIFPGQVLTIPR